MMAKHFLTGTLLSLALCVFGGCGSDKPPADNAVDFLKPAQAPGQPDTGMPEIPKDAQFTIFCSVYQEPTHIQDSQKIAQALCESTNMKKWYATHAADHSTLYYGFYRTNDPHSKSDAAEGQRAISDQNTIRAMQTTNGARLFPESLVVNIDAPDPQADPAWDITRTRGTWSIEIATFYDTPDRKERAVEAVREARKAGIEAYYYHGSSASSVCIGSWPAEAATEVTAEMQNVDGNTSLVVTNQPLPDDFTRQLGDNVKAIAPHTEVQDPTLKNEMLKYPDHATNGLTKTIVDPVSGKEIKVVEKSFLFKIPHDGVTPNTPQPHVEQVAAPIQQKPRQENGVGVLRSIGDE